ncbi:hypothetical protein CK203_064610 [Vitis vinifera]|uniref:Uncharacterized protein n=1 Tax=Vitis vinifera TaxID=29760 RepID=A0A438G303_VITVI|nr:hypothetical protein CK203_064610 [Vitis vinifera]
MASLRDAILGLGWDGYDDLLVVALPVEFRMPDIESGCIPEGARGPQALYGIEEGISRGLWADSSPSDSKGKKPGVGPKSSDIGTIVEGRLIVPLPPRPPPHPIPPGFRTDLHYAYHQRAGHDTNSCAMLRHAIQDLIDRGLVDLGRPTITTNPLPAHDTRAIPLPPGSTLRPFRLIPDEIPGQTSFSPVYLQHVPPLTHFILFPEGYGPIHRDVQIVTRSGRIAQPPPVDRPFAGMDSKKEVQREDDEILRQLRTTQARISIWSILASSNTHRDELIRALSQIRVDTATTPKGLIHFLTANRTTCIVFSDDDLPPEGSDHFRPLFIDVACLGRRVPSVLLDNGSVLNVLRIQSSFNLLLGHPWIHEAGAIPFSLHQKVKFIHEGCIIMIHSDRDVVTSSEPVLQISHSEDDLHLTGFTFDEVQVVSLKDDSRDMVPMSFDQYSKYYDTEHDEKHVLYAWFGIGLLPARVAANVFSMCFLEEAPDYDLTMDLGDGTDGVILPDTYMDEMDMIGTSRILDAAPHELHSVFDMFGVFAIDSDDVTLYDACTNAMDMIGTGRILDVAPPGPPLLLMRLGFL